MAEKEDPIDTIKIKPINIIRLILKKILNFWLHKYFLSLIKHIDTAASKMKLPLVIPVGRTNDLKNKNLI